MLGLSVTEEINYSDPKATEEVASYKAKVPLDESNIGNRMLKSMGWSEGQGLGRNSQGNKILSFILFLIHFRYCKPCNCRSTRSRCGIRRKWFENGLWFI